MCQEDFEVEKNVKILMFTGDWFEVDRVQNISKKFKTLVGLDQKTIVSDFV